MQRGGGWAPQPVSAEQWQRRDTVGGALAGLAAGDVAADAADKRAIGGAGDGLRAWLPARAADNGMFVVLSDGLDGGDHETGSGAAMIVDPCGRILAESASTDAPQGAIVSAGIDLGLINTSAGHQWLKARRPDLYAPLGQADHHAASFEPRGVSSRGSIALSFAQVSRNRLIR